MLLLLLSGALAILPGVVAALWSGANEVTTSNLAKALGEAFSGWWMAGNATLTGEMEVVVQFWGTFHVVKALVAAALLVVLIFSGSKLWVAYGRTASRARRVALGLIGIAGVPATMLVLLIFLANVQGAISPLTSVMGLLPMDGSVPEVTQVRESFAAGVTTPVLDALISDSRGYHLALVVVMGAAAVSVGIADVVLWIRWARMPRESARLRRVVVTIAAALPALGAVFLLVMLVNMSTVADTAPAVAGFFSADGF